MTHLKTHLKEKSDYYSKLSIDLQQARDHLSIKRREALQATEALKIAKSELEKERTKPPTLHRGARVLVKEDSKSPVTESLGILEEKAKVSNEAFKQATSQFKNIETTLALASPSLLIARDAFAKDEATKILSKALSQAGLLDAMRQSLTLLRISHETMETKGDVLQKLLFRALFNAVLIDKEIPSFDNALNAINERLN
jgi:hypothetical protein